ncbi:MAG: transport-associated protein [Waddliaceae bacterium]|nr:transport-associated protein [Waddliaceae bacterium]
MHIIKYIILAASTFFMGLAFTACEKEGPAEKAGKEMDEAMEQAERDYRDWRDRR